MRRIRLTVAYDGTAYSGWQQQKNGNGIENKLNEALSELCREPIAVIGASRTDAGVHALGNIAVFDTESRIPAEKFAPAVNQYLPEDIRIRRSEACDPDWHPRHMEGMKVYEYKIYNERIQNPLWRLYAHHCYYPLSLGAMRAAAEYLIGEHDFTSFANPDSQVLQKGGSAVRKLYDVTILVEHGRRYEPAEGQSLDHTGMQQEEYTDESALEHGGTAHFTGIRKENSQGPGEMQTVGAEGTRELVRPRGYYGMITIRVSGSGFLYNMVRIIAGTLLEVGMGHYEPSHIQEILKAKDRRLAGPTAEAKGLCLMKLEYR